MTKTYFTVRNVYIDMAAPDSGPTKRKFTGGDVMRCFDEEHRRSVGKIELSASEITDILNAEILEEDTVTRQAVDNRLDELVGDELVRNQHGRSYLYARTDDIDRLFAPESHTTGPATTGNDGDPPNTPQNNTAGLFSKLSGDRDTMSVPSLFILILLAFVGWKTYKTARNRVTGGGPVIDTSDMTLSIPGAIYMGVLGSAIVAIGTFGTWLALSLYTSAAAGNGLLALSYATGIAGLIATLAYAGGAIGAPAWLISRVFPEAGETA